jgi:hypothetical protein
VLVFLWGGRQITQVKLLALVGIQVTTPARLGPEEIGTPCGVTTAGVALERPLGLALDTGSLFHCYLDTYQLLLVPVCGRQEARYLLKDLEEAAEIHLLQK